ncbi:DUF4301 family protein [Barnesiella propionica]|uniref:DUF4301 family protein n=1 Tax=Barnesiella propionica TaxID=2981781 RepID=UPI0011C88838|nr:DUF4301 family protein [Barnesiella propionica]MCU6768076.1 DUF4301 family protein [Barnesiella propionica]
MYSSEDLQLLASKGITEKQIEEQLCCFMKGFPFLKIDASASIGNGILSVSPQEAGTYLNVWEQYLNENHKIVKFVPASGAASRMFKNLFEFTSASYDVPTTEFEKKFFKDIRKFAFYSDLNAVCKKNNGHSVEELMVSGEYKAVVLNLLEEKGLNYGFLPKGMLKFHHYDNVDRTAMEEHLAEGAMYAANKSKEVNVHFTVSHEHMPFFKELVAKKQALYEKEFGVKYDIGFSEQKPSTDTIAADMDNEPFRENGKLVFRPGGHGALIENLNDIDADVIFVKNIDNVVPDRLKDETVYYKKLIGGVLISLKQKIDNYVRLLKSGKYTMDDLREMIEFMHRRLFIRNPETKNLEDGELALYLLKKLDRPIRVCGMVKNVGEPGGGPFLAYNEDGTISLQILESSQIDVNNPRAKAQFESGTHFNPVDLVCSVKGVDGKFDLPKYVDKNTGFISYKSKGGKDLKALELPGLWNGAMSDWNTLFVEVPIETFNPVKTVNDLLRDQHQ